MAANNKMQLLVHDVALAIWMTETWYQDVDQFVCVCVSLSQKEEEDINQFEALGKIFKFAWKVKNQMQTMTYGIKMITERYILLDICVCVISLNNN